MSETLTSTIQTLHPDFPDEIVGSISGAHDKLLLCRAEDGTYHGPRRSREETMHRFEVADDLVEQLVAYFKRKKAEFPEWADEKNFERIRLALVQKSRQGKWPFNQSEQLWIMDRVRERSLKSDCS